MDGGNHLYKFCEDCGHKMRGKQQILDRHQQTQHGSSKGNFLGYNSLPKNCKYENFEWFLADPNQELKLKSDHKINIWKVHNNSKGWVMRLWGMQ